MNDVSWGKLPQYFYQDKQLNISINAATMFFPISYCDVIEQDWANIHSNMIALEQGAMANTGEHKKVGHYWLRNPDIAPDGEIRRAITEAIKNVKLLTGKILSGEIKPPRAERYTKFLLIGIGGSMMGAQLLADACRDSGQNIIAEEEAEAQFTLKPYFMDNTDPDGMDRVLSQLWEGLDSTLVIVASKSGKTMETQNCLHDTAKIFQRRGLEISRQCVAITAENTLLWHQATDENWLATLPVWSWVGGRTSVTSAMGLFPAALMGIDIDEFLRGAALMDESTRNKNYRDNPAAFLSTIWHFSVQCKGWQQMVILPYRDGLSYLPLYLQQLIMESLGKQRETPQGRLCHGITVFGNKGSTDQHSYIQQILEGPPNNFVNFIEVRKDKRQLHEKISSGDCLRASLYGIRQALLKKDRPSLTITLEQLTPLTLGALIALYERAVGYYAFMLGINAYDQPAVEEGKLQASAILSLQKQLMDFLIDHAGRDYTVEQISEQMNLYGREEQMWNILENVVLNQSDLFTRQDTAAGILKSQYGYREQ